MRWNDALNAVSFDELGGTPAAVYKYFAYKQGEVLSFDTECEALQVSDLVEKVKVNAVEIEEHKKRVNEYLNYAFDLWYKELREEFSDLPDEIFELCYSKGYDRGHAYGYDEIASYVADECYFIDRIITAYERSKNAK